MKAQFSNLDDAEIQRFLARASHADYSYQPTYGTQSDQAIEGFDNDHHSVMLGRGEQVWSAARQVLTAWNQFPDGWTKIEPKAALETDQIVAVIFRLFGLWWINAAKIVYTIDEPDRFGFAYGTLKDHHVEAGEECFWIERDASGVIRYHIRAFSRPAHWLVRLGYPVARWHQAKFVRESLAQMKQIVAQKVMNLDQSSAQKINYRDVRAH